MFDLFIKISPIVIGWFVILDTSRHITSRNEAKSAIEELIKNIEECLTESLKDWQVYCGNIKSGKTNEVLLNIQMMKFTRIKNLNLLINNYGLSELERSEVVKIKKVLTTTPEWKSYKNDAEYESFLRKKLEMSKVIQAETSQTLYRDFYTRYPAVVKPFVSTTLKEYIIWPALILFLLIMYFEALDYILSI